MHSGTESALNSVRNSFGSHSSKASPITSLISNTVPIVGLSGFPKILSPNISLGNQKDKVFVV